MALNRIEFKDVDGTWETVEIPDTFKVSTLANKDIRIYYKGKNLSDLSLSELQWEFSEYARNTFTRLIQAKDGEDPCLLISYEMDEAIATVITEEK